MARRTKLEAAATRETLLDAAEAVFRDKGVARTSLADIAQVAGLTRGAVYWHFRDKAQLFEAMCDRASMPMEAMVASVGSVEQADPMAALRQLAVHGLTRLATDPRTQAVFDVVFHKSEVAGELTAVARRQQSSDSDCRKHVVALFQQAIAKGQLPADTDARIAAETMHSFVVGVMYEWVQNPGAYDLARAAPAMCDAVLAGLRAAPPRRAASSPARRTPARRGRTTAAA
jgi:TetR/AcrR family acrAB operon transcriptional repressor